MKKILYVTSLSGRRINSFMLSSVLAAREAGFAFHMASNQDDADMRLYKEDAEKYGIQLHHIDFRRNPFNPMNLMAYGQLFSLMKREHFDMVHCNTPIGGFIGRLCAKKAKIYKVIYTAHGFHFFKGAPLLNWLVYYPAEWFCSFLTDVLVTINKEDYNFAKKHMHAKKIEYIPGVGIDSEKFNGALFDRDKKREELNIPKDAFVLMSVGELNKNKNHEVIIRAVNKIKDLKVYYIICGNGNLEGYLKEMSTQFGLEKQIKFLGFRNDVADIYKIADVFAFSSIREGLAVSLMEAMASGLPCVVSDIRGNVDLIEDGKGGYLCCPMDAEAFAERISVLASDVKLRKKMGLYNMEKIKDFDIEKVKADLSGLYGRLLLE
ncbi:MAG: glycosyltransferase family 4 protein [Clostridia bacterium]|nr:glycosyltransferase family 4 protein [Clostridia bacterium]